MLVKLQSAISLLTCGCMVAVASMPSSIGVVVIGGQAQVDGALVRGNSTVFQGSNVRAVGGSSDLMLPGGSNLLLQPGSAARVYRDYAVLQNGFAVERGGRGYTVVADGLKVSFSSPQSAVLVGMPDGSHVNVAAQSGFAEVRNPAGNLLARLEPGKSLSFSIQAVPQSTPAAPTEPPAATPGAQLTVHGILRTDHPGRYGHFLLTDVTSKITYELQGPGLDDLVGGSVEATGSTFDTVAAQGASKVLAISDIHQMPLGEMTASPSGPTSATATTQPGAAESTPTPSGDTAATTNGGAEVGATPEATAPPEVSTVPAITPLPQHTDTGKIILIVALAAGGAVGVALGLAGGKSSTVSPE